MRSFVQISKIVMSQNSQNLNSSSLEAIRFIVWSAASSSRVLTFSCELLENNFNFSGFRVYMMPATIISEYAFNNEQSNQKFPARIQSKYCLSDTNCKAVDELVESASRLNVHVSYFNNLFTTIFNQ